MTADEMRLLAERVFKQLFRDYVAAQEMTTDQMECVTIREFVEWLNEHDHLSQVREAYIETLGVPYGLMMAIQASLADPWTAVATLYPCWLSLQVMGRPPCKRKAVEVRVNVAVIYEPSPSDKAAVTQGGEEAVVVQTPCCVVGAKAELPSPATDSILASQLELITRQVTEGLAKMGIDKLYDLVPDADRGETP